MVGAVAIAEVGEGGQEVPGVASLRRQSREGLAQRLGRPGLVGRRRAPRLRPSSPAKSAAPVGGLTCGHGARCYWRCPRRVRGLPSSDRRRTSTFGCLAEENRSNVKNAHRWMARCTFAGVVAAGACIAVVGATPQRVSGAPAPLTLSETWATGGTILNDAPCGVAESSPVEFNDGGTPGSRSVTARAPSTDSTCRPAPCSPGWGSGSGNTVGSGQGCLTNPSGGVPGDRRQRRRGPGQPARRLDRLGEQRQRALLRRRQRGRAGRRRLLRLQRERDRGLEPGRHQPGHRHRPRRRRPGLAPDRRRGIAGGRRLAGADDVRPQQRQRRAGPGLAAVLRRQRLLHRGGGRLLRHGLGRLRRRRRVLAGVRAGHALHRRRARPDLQRPRRADLQRQHRTRRSTPPPPSAPSCPAAPTASPPGPAPSTRVPATRTR